MVMVVVLVVTALKPFPPSTLACAYVLLSMIIALDDGPWEGLPVSSPLATACACLRLRFTHG